MLLLLLCVENHETRLEGWEKEQSGGFLISEGIMAGHAEEESGIVNSSEAVTEED